MRCIIHVQQRCTYIHTYIVTDSTSSHRGPAHEEQQTLDSCTVCPPSLILPSPPPDQGRLEAVPSSTYTEHPPREMYAGTQSHTFSRTHTPTHTHSIDIYHTNLCLLHIVDHQRHNCFSVSRLLCNWQLYTATIIHNVLHSSIIALYNGYQTV